MNHDATTMIVGVLAGQGFGVGVLVCAEIERWRRRRQMRRENER